MFSYVFWALLIPVSAGILYQDIRFRTIQVWLMVVFNALVWGRYFALFPLEVFFTNLLFCTLYALLCYVVLSLYFYLRTGKRVRILDHKFGFGDVWLLFCIGPVLTPDVFIYFFTLVFIVALLFHFVFAKRGTSIPLAAYMVGGYVGYELYVLLVL